ncbi:hypothetical protein BX666DRAFT_1882687 [Dichotomocladium elegans]|nr:hypothetical protein BX666DRAFT_1882687 [Dichotomocladium elegans]
MFTAREYSIERLVRIMHIRGVEVLYGAEAMSKSMLRFSSGRMEMFEQDFIIDIERDEMRVYNKDEANDYVYKYSTLRQFFFEQDIVHKGHEYVTSDVLVYALRRLPLGTKPVRHSPVVDIRDDFVFLKTYVLTKTWDRHSSVPVQPLILSCHRIIFNQVKNHLVSIEKPDDEYLITTKRYLRTLNSEFVVNGKTFENFEKLPAECFDSIAVALLIEALKEKMATNTLVHKVFEETQKAFERKPLDKFASKGLNIFGKYVA